MKMNEHWLVQVMDSAKVSPGFRERCENAALLALDIAKMRDEKQRVGFVALSFRAYLEGLGKIAGVSLAPILVWFGIPDLEAVPASAAAALAGLTRELDISAREAFALMRVSVAERLGVAPVPLLAARRRSGGPSVDPLEECERTLKQIESDYPAEVQGEITRMQSAIASRYER